MFEGIIRLYLPIRIRRDVRVSFSGLGVVGTLSIGPDPHFPHT